MTQENTEKPEKPAAKSAELQARIRYAATLKYLANLTDAQLAEQLEVSIHTIADWKRRWNWDEAIREIAQRQIAETTESMFAMAPYARDVLQQLMREAPPGVRLKAAQAVLNLVLNSITAPKMHLDN